jgi:hypothetical protein
MSNSCCGKNVKDQNNSFVRTEHTSSVYDTTDRLVLKDALGNFLVRWGVGRMNYKVAPGLYKKGNPDSESPVLVTANYKLTIDSVRKELEGLNVWIIVLDTNGVNVWCAAGKGTFGTEELIQKIESVNLKNIVSHRTIILPQLGAPGIASHEIAKATGFRTVYGPVYARDIKEFLNNNMKATQEMRRVHFGIKERLKVIPMEIVLALFLIPVFIAGLSLFNLIEGTLTVQKLLIDCIPYFGAFISGTIIFQLIFPYFPGRSFALKGWVLGLIWAAVVNLLFDFSVLEQISHLLIVPMIVSFLSLNFTGATTFTSLSGVLKEVRLSTPFFVAGIAGGILVRTVSVFIN